MANKTIINFYSRLALFAAVFAFVVILLGAYTRLSNAGLSCPDWPRCFGYLTVPQGAAEVSAASKAYPHSPVDTAKAWIEMRHRYLAGCEGLLILALVLLSWRWRSKLSPLAFGLSQSLIGVMSCQVLLGMLTVTALLKPVIVLSHLLLGFSIMAILWLLWLFTAPYLKLARLSPKLRPWIVSGLIILILQISLGGWVSTHYAGLACVDLPYCQGQLVPTLHWRQFNTDLITIHMLHRIGAVVTALYLGALSLFLISQASSRRFGLVLGSLLIAQLILGVLNILWFRPVHIALAHNATAALLLLTLLALLARCSTPKKELHHD